MKTRTEWKPLLGKLLRTVPFALFLGLIPTVATSVTAHPELVSSEITDLATIEEISKFRSGAGHDFSYDATFPFGSSDSTEPPSSMKHYFAPYAFHNGDQYSVPVYAPFAGEITRVTEESGSWGVNKRVEIQSATHPEYTLIVFHINLGNDYPQILNDWPIEFWPTHQEDDADYTTRSVAPGDLLGYADMRDSHDFDIAVLFTDTDDERYWISYFDLMSDALFLNYSSRGLLRSDLSISKADRLLTPVDWWGGRNEDDWVSLVQAVPLDPWVSATAVATLSLLLLLFLKPTSMKPVRFSRARNDQSAGGAKRQTSLSTFK
ncbi:MAG: hypothetical protein VX252_06995 [Myxococcota bacterium]|nr:hypothetical protein [Myxococcota bacterium]